MSVKLITGVLIGAGTALAIGYLMTDEGIEMRKKIKENGEDVLDFICDAFDKGKEVVKDYVEKQAQKNNLAQEP